MILINKLIDIFLVLVLVLDLEVIELLDGPEFNYSGIYVAGVMEETKSYAYLNRRYAFLAPNLAIILKKDERGWFD